MSTNLKNCPICKSTEFKDRHSHENDSVAVNCRRCGYFSITDTAIECDYGNSEHDLYLFSGYLRANSTRKDPILIKSDSLDGLKSFVLPLKSKTIIEKLNIVINFIGTKTSIGEQVTIDLDYDFVVFYCKNSSELFTLLEYAEKLSLLKFSRSAMGDIYSTGQQPNEFDLELMFEGWKRFDENRKTSVDSKKVFIAMNFDKEFDDVFFNAIFKACEQCGFDAMRVDKSEHNEKICDKIISDIKTSKFLIAEFTGQKHGVYFEAGFAYGLGLPVIWCCRKDEVEKLHFDTRQYNHIIWSTLDELKEKLINRIKATIT